MAKNPVKKSSKKKSRRTSAGEPRALRIEIEMKKPTIKDIELAIKKKLEAERTDLFRNCGTLLIVIEEEGGPPRGQ